MNNNNKYSVHIRGITPLIMSCDKGCNPLSPITKRLKEITSIKSKTDEHHIAISRLQFESRMYFDDELGIYMPANCLMACMKAAARKYKKGKDTKAILLDEAIGYPLMPYKGETIDSMYNLTNKKGDHPHVYITNVVVNRSRVVCTRPIFHKWEVNFNLFLNVEIMTEDTLKMILETAGFEYGLCEMRPELATGNFGKFEVLEFKNA